MIKSFIFTLIVILGGILLISSCDNLYEDIDKDIVIPEKRDSRFLLCYFEEDLAKNTCDSVLISFFGANAYMNLKLNDDISFVGCDEGDDLEMLSFGDENCCVPRTYDLVYDMILNGDTIYQIPMVAGSEMKFDFVSEDEKKQLAGYALLLDGKIEFDYADLKALLKSEKLNPEIYDIELTRDTLVPHNDVNAFFWDVSFFSNDDEMRVTEVNAMTGEFSSIRPITRMGD
ncbi:MAG: hypothetical protein P8P74_01195 [Crocinitomicaceae bacterium]|nr:hypothetical protein [Crocinitomicaceae bacterium]